MNCDSVVCVSLCLIREGEGKRRNVGREGKRERERETEREKEREREGV